MRNWVVVYAALGVAWIAIGVIVALLAWRLPVKSSKS
jgi:hypothetical protein